MSKESLGLDENIIGCGGCDECVESFNARVDGVSEVLRKELTMESKGCVFASGG